MKKTAILALEDGTIFKGTSIGIEGISCGEVVFNTAMTGYQEILTDPSYAEQMITFTYPHIGNVGVNPEDEESKRIWAAGIIIRSLSPLTSNWRAEVSLIEYLKTHKVVGIADIDTRKLTHLLREKGALNGCIMAGQYDPQTALAHAQAFEGLNGKNLTPLVTTETPYELFPRTTVSLHTPFQVVVVDFGVKQSILQQLTALGCHLTVVPATTTAEDILNYNPNGILLSNGPGDPNACKEIIVTIKTLLKTDIPLFGICLGHQLLALAMNGRTLKMKFGHHGANHPVQNMTSKEVMITSQNHGFMVDELSLPENIEPTHRSLFDGSLQGIRHREKAVYGFQGHPEAGPGPFDALTLFKPFIQAMKVKETSTIRQTTYA